MSLLDLLIWVFCSLVSFVFFLNLYLRDGEITVGGIIVIVIVTIIGPLGVASIVLSGAIMLLLKYADRPVWRKRKD